MSIIPIFFGKVEYGKIIFDDPKRYSEYIYTLNGKDIQAIVEKKKKKRSLKENRYYRGVVVKILAKELGLTPGITHEILANQFLKIGVTTVDGKRYEIVRSTASLTTAEFEEYAEQCRTWANTEHNCFIPLPNEVEWK